MAGVFTTITAPVDGSKQLSFYREGRVPTGSVSFLSLLCQTSGQ